MTGKKVFTGAGEYLASFLLSIDKDSTESKLLDDTIADLTSSNLELNKLAITKYQAKLTKEELITYIKEQFRKEISYQKVTGFGSSGKEMSPQEIAQILFNTIKWVEVETEARFETLAELTFDNIANIFKTIGIYNRNYNRTLKILKQTIADFNQFSLDDFVGDTNDKSRIFYRMDGASIKICDGAGTGASFKEIIRAKTKSFMPNQAYIGDELIIGGTEESSPFKSLRLSKVVYADDDIIMASGKHFVGTAMKARYADLAEYYTSNMEYRPGTLLQIDTNNQNEVTIFQFDSASENNWCIGVVSDKPGFILNDELASDFPIVPVVLTGRSPVRVIGKVEKGDFIYPSIDIPGVAIAIPQSEANVFNRPDIDFSNRIGIALESSQPIQIGFDNSDNINESLINCKLG